MISLFHSVIYLSERKLHVGVSIEVVAGYCLSDLSNVCWRRRTNRLLLLCGRHPLFYQRVKMCVLKREERSETIDIRIGNS